MERLERSPGARVIWVSSGGMYTRRLDLRDPNWTARRQYDGVKAYAENGLWYDALAAAADDIRVDPANAALRGVHDSLLRQAGLEMAVAGSAD